MELFWGIFFSFPVVIFSALLTICILYWFVAALGLLSIDCLDLDISVNDIYSDIPPTGFGGLLMKFGFNEVPMTLILTLISLIGWSFCYFSFRLLILPLYDLTLLYYLAGIVLLIIAFILAVYLTAFFIKPIRPLFKKMMITNNHKSLLGQVIEIRSSTVTKTKGQAIFEDGGAGLILEVRCDESYQFNRGDKAVILQYDETANCYEIISLKDFNGQ
ncbi:hypothetical protein [Gilliamella apicola]|uniref:DUF1449 domain-containing protein n=1 Tax=Gilliamella apicola TaxID=1196095 RepID=A0A2V4DVR3_9GAMM|nr:hypothetical protein [Gilliamella apicola]KES18705.1 hypothetical protein GASC598I20_020730 [Gilliamella apicola SCGC AB-598-I20]PXZ04313.1 hypothetical protein DKK79_08110 [Gilliamella apicola]